MDESSMDEFVHTPAKKRRIHMTLDECQKFADSPDLAGKILSNPVGSQFPKKDINFQHLYPKQFANKKATATCVTGNCDPDDGTTSKVELDYNEKQVGSFRGDLVNSFKSGQFGGFTSAAKLHDENPGLYSQIDVKMELSPNLLSKKQQKPADSKQKSIKTFFTEPSTSKSRSTPIIITDSPVTTPKKTEEIDYSSPVKMYSPIKKVEGSDNIYVSDESPCSSHRSDSSNQNSGLLKDNNAVKQLFEGQKQYQLNKNQNKGKKIKNSKKPSTNRVISRNSRVQTLKRDSSNLSLGHISSDDDDILCTAVQSPSSTFGLVGAHDGDNSDEEEKIDYFEQLPDELLEVIFAQLPMLDLCLNSNRVCIRWSQIISSEKFVPWKKRYNRLKKGLADTKREILLICSRNGMVPNKPAEFLCGLIRYMKSFKPITAANMIQCLQKHKKYEWAKAFLEERFPDCLLHGEPNPWSCIAALAVISRDVYDVQEIIRCLLVPMSQCTSIEVLECLYCIATLLYQFKLFKVDDVWNGMHYRVFCALYLYENASATSLADLKGALLNKGGQQSLVKYSNSRTSVLMTHEQSRIVNYNVEPGEVIKIVAFAGTGKTTTLVRYTKMRPSMRFLLVVYNKSVCEHANTQFPGNVLCKTGHSLAFRTTGRRYGAVEKNKQKKLRNLKVYDITQALTPRKGDNLFIRAKFVMDTVNNFIASADPCITTEHVPEKRPGEDGQMVYIDSEKKRLYAEDARQIWSQMLDLNNLKVGMTHDGYLKVYQLSKPKLLDFDCILIDEAQDMSPALSDILLTQPQAKILVGDPHQQIYAFRGAVNAMSRVNSTTTFYLTQSFRFGPEIAQIAASCLETLKEEKMKTLVGNGKKCFVTGETVGQVAIICRSNFTVFNEAVKKCCFGDQNVKVAFVGGTEGFGFPVLQDIYTLMMSPEQRQKENRIITDRLIKNFHNLGELERYATKTLDNELMGKIKIVRTHHHSLLIYINRILSKCVKDLKAADFILSTAHKAKGLEFSTVKITDDYGVNPILAMLFKHVPAIVQAMPANAREVNMDEGNLLYVAVTRAKHALQMSPTLRTILLLCGERFEHPEYSKVLEQKGITMKCVETDQEFKPYTLTLQRDSFKLADETKFEGGVISPDIITDQRLSLSKLFGLLDKDKKNRPPPPVVEEIVELDFLGM